MGNDDPILSCATIFYYDISTLIRTVTLKFKEIKEEYATLFLKDAYVLIELSTSFNNDSISYATNSADGGFNVWKNSFPAEELPSSHSIVDVAGVPFCFPPKEDGQYNTVVCCGQKLDIPPGLYDWLYILAASERRTEDLVYLHYTNGAVEAEWLRISDFWPAPSRYAPYFGEYAAFRCKQMHYPRHVQPGVEPVIWRQRIPVTRQDILEGIHLPDNIAIHIFAMTAIRAIGNAVQ